MRREIADALSLIQNTVMATITAGLDQFGVAVTPDGKRVYVANFASISQLAAIWGISV